MPKGRTSDLLLLFMNQLIWGTGWSAIKTAQEKMGPVVLNIWTLGISVVALYPFVHRELRNEFRKRSLGEYADFLIMGVVGLTGMTLLYAWGAGRSLATNGAVISTSVPILTSVVAAIVLGEKMTLMRLVSLGIALIGVFTLSDIRWSELDLFGGYLFANLLLLGGTLANAIYIVYSKKLLSSNGPVMLLFWGQLIGCVGSVPFLYFEDFDVAAVAGYTWKTWLSLVFMGVVFFAATMIIFFKILVRLDAGQVMVSCYLQPVFGVLMASVLLGERITFGMIFSGLLVLAGTTLATYGDSWQPRLRRVTPAEARAEPADPSP